MKPQHHHIFTPLLCALFLISSCVKDGFDTAEPRAASLSVSVSIPGISMGVTKSMPLPATENGAIVSDPFAKNLAGWTEHEKLIDGHIMYRLTLFLIDRESGELAGYRDLYQGSADITGNQTSGSDGTTSASKEEYGSNGFIENGSVRDIHYGTAAMVNFRYDHPLHNISADKSSSTDPLSPECLTRGEYRIIVVANWAADKISVRQSDGTTAVQDHPGVKNYYGHYLAEYVESVISEFQAQTPDTRKKFNEYADYHNLMDFTLYADPGDDIAQDTEHDMSKEQFLCQIKPQPLVLVKDITLNPGENRISGELKRCWARLRVTVENLSPYTLTVHDLSFGDNTTRNEQYLFYTPGAEDNALGAIHSHTLYGAPKIEVESALPHCNSLVSFTKETEIPGIVLNANSQDNSRVLFDGYILESNGNGKNFFYNLDLEYVGHEVMGLQRAKKSDGSWDVINNPDAIIDGETLVDGLHTGLYVIQNQAGTHRILKKGNGQIETELVYKTFPDKMMAFSGDQVFKFIPEKDDDGKIKTETVTVKDKSGNNVTRTYPLYRIKTYDRHEAAYWFGTPGRKSNLPLVLQKDIATVFTVRDDGVNNEHKDLTYLSFLSKTKNESGIFDYMNVYGNNQSMIAGWKDNDGGSQFSLHRVEEVVRKAVYNAPVTLTTIDPETAVSKPVSAIRRNDFINICITASYNKDDGEIYFSVKDWNKIDGQIEFN